MARTSWDVGVVLVAAQDGLEAQRGQAHRDHAPHLPDGEGEEQRGHADPEVDLGDGIAFTLYGDAMTGSLYHTYFRGAADARLMNAVMRLRKVVLCCLLFGAGTSIFGVC